MRPGIVALAVTSLVIGGLTGPASPARAAAPTCRGLAATIVGEPAERVDGTDGDDVIVTNGAEQIEAGAGDDTVCVTATGRNREISVVAGPGADVVDTGGVRSFTSTELGPGADEMYGGPGRDWVVTGDFYGDADTDRVETGAGTDNVFSGETGLPNPDDVDLGTDPGDLTLYSEQATGALTAAPGSGATLDLGPHSAGDWVIDDSVGQATLDGTTMVAWTNLHVGSVDGRARTRLHYVGTDDRDRVYLWGHISGVELGAGRDELDLLATGGVSGAFLGGPGRDLLRFDLEDEVLADLQHGRLGTHVDRADADIDGFEDLDVGPSTRVDLHGTAGPNTITFAACTARVRGGGGADQLVSAGSSVTSSPCANRSHADVWLFGGPGDDRLSGTELPEHLIGGPGQDRADGGRGHDVCRAEREVSCEA